MTAPPRRPERPQESLSLPQDGSKTAQDGPRTAHDGLKTGKKAPETLQVVPRGPPRGPQEDEVPWFPLWFSVVLSFSPFRASDSLRWHKTLQDCPKTAQEALNSAPRRPQDGPSCPPRRLRWSRLASKTVPRRLQDVQDAPQESPRLPHDASKTAQDEPNDGPRWLRGP